MREVTENGIALIRQFEGCMLSPYQDSKGVYTIGIGHTLGVTASTPPITEDEANDLLLDDLATAEREVSQLITVPLNDNQFDALVSLVFNCGPAPLTGTLGKVLNAGNYQSAANAFLVWNHCDHKILPGLTARRQAEMSLFLTPMNPANKPDQLTLN